MCAVISTMIVAGKSDVDFSIKHLQSVAEYKNISFSEAEKLIEAQAVQRTRIDEITEKGLAGDGVFLDDAELVVNATDENFVPVSKFVSGFDSSDIRVRRVQNGLQWLNDKGSEVERISSEFPGVIESWVPNVTTDRLDVSLISSSPDFAEVSGELKDLGIVDVLDIGDGPTELTVYEGIGYVYEIPNSRFGCSAGPTFVNKNTDVLYTLTAAHCLINNLGSDIDYFSGIPLGTASHVASTGSDIGLIKQNRGNQFVNDFHIYDDDDGYTIEEQRTPTIGALICQHRGSSRAGGGSLCGQITTRSSSATTFHTDICASPGDSGSAIVDPTGTIVYGTTKMLFGVANTCLYTEHEYIDDVQENWPNLRLYTDY